MISLLHWCSSDNFCCLFCIQVFRLQFLKVFLMLFLTTIVFVCNVPNIIDLDCEIRHEIHIEFSVGSNCFSSCFFFLVVIYSLVITVRLMLIQRLSSSMWGEKKMFSQSLKSHPKFKMNILNKRLKYDTETSEESHILFVTEFKFLLNGTNLNLRVIE